MLKHKKPNKYFIMIILWTTFIIIFSAGVKIFAVEMYSIEDKNTIENNVIVLDDQSSQELFYISPNQSILLFRSATPQLEQLQVDDILWVNATVNANYGFLGQIKFISKEKAGNTGFTIQTIPYSTNHAPIISGLIARPSTLDIGQQCDLTCYAADEDKDELFYNWISSGGNILGNGADITWMAPNLSGNYSIECEVTDRKGLKDRKTVQLWVLEKYPLLTEQEKELIRKNDWGNSRVIRWPDGYVEVYDATHYDRMQEVLDQWNEVIGGKVVFYLSNNPQSPVKITYNPELKDENLCYHIDTHWNNYQLYAAEIKINPDSSLCGYPENSYALYLHSFSGVTGFNVWKGETVNRKDWQNFNLISEIMQMMIKALYQVPPGYDLNKDQ